MAATIAGKEDTNEQADGWLDPASKEGDYALAHWDSQVTQEGPGVMWAEMSGWLVALSGIQRAISVLSPSRLA